MNGDSDRCNGGVDLLRHEGASRKQRKAIT